MGSAVSQDRTPSPVVRTVVYRVLTMPSLTLNMFNRVYCVEVVYLRYFNVYRTELQDLWPS
jgi:hypothetical protein